MGREGRRAGGWTEHRVTEEEAGLSVQELLTGPLGVSRRMIQRLTRGRGIELNRRPPHLQRRVSAGDLLRVRLAAPEEPGLPPVEMELAIAYEDDDLLVVDKPPFVLVHPTAPHHTRTLAHGVAHHLALAGAPGRVRPVHRLDRDTSGLVLFARSAHAHQRLDRELREGRWTAATSRSSEGWCGRTRGASRRRSARTRTTARCARCGPTAHRR